METFPPGSTLGVVGGGQLGRMLCFCARRMGYRTVVWTGGLEAPATAVADESVDLPFDSAEALARFARLADVATIEFENIPRASLESLAAKIPLHPSPEAVAICQNREREKKFLRANGIPCARFELVDSAQSLSTALARLGTPAVLKTADFGYDGKGQRRLDGEEDPAEVWADFDGGRAVLEAFVPFEREISVMVARSGNGSTRTFDPAENRHRHHMLDLTIVPARIPEESDEEARRIATDIAEALDYRGIMGVEFFLMESGELLVNEMAPRPHNSGHHTLDACATSQFEQQLRAVCGLPLGSTRLLSPVVMLNLLGDLWPGEEQAPDWMPLLADEEGYLHLYGKSRAVGRRKMGHANLLGAEIEDCLSRAETLKENWLGQAAEGRRSDQPAS